MTPPLVVVEAPDEVFAQVIAELTAAGWRVVEGFSATFVRPAAKEGSIRAGVVDSADDAIGALLAALSGAGLVIKARAPREIVDRLIDDLRRLGPVDHRVGPAAPTVTLGVEAQSLLALLAEGHSLGEAAEMLGLARRTADRRIAEARHELGVERTTEAIARARRLGLLGRRSS